MTFIFPKKVVVNIIMDNTKIDTKALKDSPMYNNPATM
jgi:hypothetical protein